jgi:hypothetical protein
MMTLPHTMILSMASDRPKASSWISLAIFVIVLTKDILIGGFKIIPVRGLLNMELSWLFILPISLLGMVLAIQAIRKAVLGRKKSRVVNIDIILSLPILLYVILALLFS